MGPFYYQLESLSQTPTTKRNSLGNEDLQCYIDGCDAVISCLGHVITFKSVFGHPRDLVRLSFLFSTPAPFYDK